MKFNPNGLVVTAAFFGLLWYAVEHQGVDAGAMQALALVAVSVFFGWLSFGVIHGAPWPRRRRDR
jgi:hypothetical protein